MKKTIISLSLLTVITLGGALVIYPRSVSADHTATHTLIQSLQAQIKTLQEQVQKLRQMAGDGNEKSTPVINPVSPDSPPLSPTVIEPIFDTDTSDDNIIQLNNLRIRSISSKTLPAVITASHSFGIRCLQYRDLDAPTGLSIPCPVPPDILYHIRVDSDTILLLRNRVRASFSDFTVGDRINAYGFMDRNTQTIEALIVRNLDRPEVKQFIQLNNVEVISISASAPPATITVVQSHISPCFDYGLDGNAPGAPIPCPLGVESNTTGGETTIGNSAEFYYPIQRKYEVSVNANTRLMNRNRVSMPLSDISAGDILNIYGNYIPNAPHVIEALVVRDLSKPEVNSGVLRVAVSDGDLACLNILPGMTGTNDSSYSIPCGILYDATVMIEKNGAVVAKGTTNRGFALFDDLPVGTYTVKASAPGYEQGSQDVTVRGGKINTVTVLLKKGIHPISIRSFSRLSGAVGASFNAVFAASGGQAPYKWNVTSGSLPPGLSLVAPPQSLLLDAPCYIDSGGGGTPARAGTYKFGLTAVDSQGRSGAETFVATISLESRNYPPVIHGVSGPVTLNVGEVGTWTVKANDPENQPLTYSVIWGDESAAAPTNEGATKTITQSATFTHSYQRLGIYTPKFIVTDSGGLSAKTSVNVVVEQVLGVKKPVISSIFPSSGRVGVQLTINGAGFLPTGNRIDFTGYGSAGEFVSRDGKTIIFEIPDYLNPPCYYYATGSDPACLAVVIQLEPGDYKVVVTNANGISNSAGFTVLPGIIPLSQ
jgi:hypothetical protein